MINLRRLFAFAMLALLALLIALPALVVRGCVSPFSKIRKSAGIPVTVNLYRHDTRSVHRMDLEEYLIGVLAGEVPALFEEEALKAQAIVARTYVVRRLKCFGGPGSECHPDADICDEPGHGQAYVSEEKARAKWGALAGERHWQKLAAAVAATESMVVTYKGTIIDPAYHSTCGGQTEDAANVWSRSLPYLQSVECKWCTDSPRFRNITEMALKDFSQRIGDKANAIPALARRDGRKVIEVLDASSSGRALRVKAGTIVLKGTEFRQSLGLNSTNFGWQVSGDRIRFETRGFGHGVGMCQYGANGMAKEGRKAGDILGHYFRGTLVASMWQTR